MAKPTACPECGASLEGLKWSLFHGLTGPVDFTQCAKCGTIIHTPKEPPPDASQK